MNTINAFACYPTDGEGYLHGSPIKLYPFRAAAEAFCREYFNGYGRTVNVKCIGDEEKFIVKSRVSIDRLKPAFPLPLWLPIQVFYYETNGQNTFYTNSSGIGDLLSDIASHKLDRISNIRQGHLLNTGTEYFELAHETPIQMEKIKHSRELAIQEALSKLTEEEKQLLGL